VFAPEPGPNDRRLSPNQGHEFLDIPSSRFGLSLGNSTRFTGIRFNLSDRHVESINGLSISLSKPGKNPNARFYGVAIGVVGTSAHLIKGASFNLMGAGADRMEGVLVSAGLTDGLDIRGVGFGLLKLGYMNMSGLGVGGFAAVGMNIHGLCLGGTGVLARRINGGAFATLGINAEEMRGVFLAGMAVSGRRVHGITSGGSVVCEDLEGVHLALLFLKAENLSGLGTGGFTLVGGRLEGMTIGIFNYASSLSGVQIGLLNYAGNNPGGLKLLPLLNAHFD